MSSALLIWDCKSERAAHISENVLRSCIHTHRNVDNEVYKIVFVTFMWMKYNCWKKKSNTLTINFEGLKSHPNTYAIQNPKYKTGFQSLVNQ